MFNALEPLWRHFMIILAVSGALLAAYLTGIRIASTLQVADWSEETDKPLPPEVSRHATLGLIGGGLAFLVGVVNLFRHGKTGFLEIAAVVMALAAVLSGVIRLYAGGSGRWHMAITLVALLVFGTQLGVSAMQALHGNRSRAAWGEEGALGSDFYGMDRERTAGDTARDRSAYEPGKPGSTVAIQVDAAIASAQIVKDQTAPAGRESGNRQERELHIEGVVSGDLTGRMVLDLQQVTLPDDLSRNTAGQIRGRIRMINPETGTINYQGRVFGLVRLSGVWEMLAGLDGANPLTFGQHLELAGYLAPPALDQGVTFPMAWHGEYVRELRLNRFAP